MKPPVSVCVLGEKVSAVRFPMFKSRLGKLAKFWGYLACQIFPIQNAIIAQFQYINLLVAD